jgi:hypothetical protein
MIRPKALAPFRIAICGNIFILITQRTELNTGAYGVEREVAIHRMLDGEQLQVDNC